MVCSHCGADSPKNKNFCVECGKEIKKNKLVGYSTKINDPAFKKYIKDTKTWSLLFAVILSLIVTISFYIYGETSNEMENPEALFIGLIISAMFIVIALIQVISINKTKTFDGVVIDKKIEEHSRRRHTSNNDYYIEEYLDYYVLIKADNNTISLRAEDDDTVFNYFNIGDKVRHHGKLKTYEKYDKSNDSIIFCNACSSLNDIEADYCFRCKCPLLK